MSSRGIGRCDRLGQRSDKVHVGSLASVGTIEQRILSRLYTRLRVFEQALGDMEVILGEEVASFERDVFTRNLSSQQQEERLERISQAIENQEQQRESITQSSVISLQGRQLIESDQEEIREAESRFLSPEEVGEFVHASLESRFTGSLRRTSNEDQFDVSGTGRLRDALQGLLRAYPSTHYARTEIVRFRKRLEEQKKIKVSFSGGWRRLRVRSHSTSVGAAGAAFGARLTLRHPVLLRRGSIRHSGQANHASLGRGLTRRLYEPRRAPLCSRRLR